MGRAMAKKGGEWDEGAGIALEREIWEHNLGVIRESLAHFTKEGTARLVQAKKTLDSELQFLNAQRDLKGKSREAKKNPCQEKRISAHIDSLITEKERRRKQLAILEKRPLSSRAFPIDLASTAETLCKPARRDPIEDLKKKEYLNDDHVRAALEIRDIYEAVCKGVRLRTLEMTGPIDRNFWRVPEIPGNLSNARRCRFLPWAEFLRRDDPAALDITLRIAVFGISIFATSRAQHLSWKKCVAKFVRSLDLYWEIAQKNSCNQKDMLVR